MGMVRTDHASIRKHGNVLVYMYNVLALSHYTSDYFNPCQHTMTTE